MSEMLQMGFSIEGSFITKMAREKLYICHDLSGALDLLKNSLCSDQINDEQRTILALKILNYDAEIVGTYPGDNYGVDIINEESSFDKIVAVIEQSCNNAETIKSEYNDLLKRYLFVCECLSDYEIDDINTEYYQEYDEPLFPDIKIPAWKKAHVHYSNESTMLESFLKMKNRESDDPYLMETEYGWLSPDGDFHPAEWATHEQWASDYLSENYPFDKYPDLYWISCEDGSKQHITGGDVLINKLNWCLIDNPYRGEGYPRYNLIKGLTKSQKEFLYDYFIGRDRHKEASELYNE